MMGVWHVRMGAGAAWRKTVWGEFLSEYLGTFTLIAFGDGVVAVAVAGLNQSGRAATNHTIFLASGDWLLITFGWFVAVVLGIYVAGGISGAHINPVGPFIDELIGTALLIGVVLAIIDERNLAPKGNLGPFIIGLLVAGIGMSFGPNTGYAINPARDFGPRLFAWFAGWDGVALPGNYGNVNWYWWLPIVAPIVGGLIGAVVYDFFIHQGLMARGEPE